jgi:sporulation protein YlmC with PRC-barrel domain
MKDQNNYMQHNIKRLLGFKMAATDGNVGEVKEFYFDDQTWAICYLIIETGNWLANKKMLIATQALLVLDWANKIFPVNLAKEQITNSPYIDTDQPVSRRQEIEMYRYYALERRGGSGFYAGNSAAVMNLPPIADEEIIKENDPDNNDDNYDPHLRSTDSVSGYHIHTTDGDIGHVTNFIVDDQAWKITDLVIDIHNWIGGNKVVIPFQACERNTVEKF